jgi:DNA invertase Pin-like site-specific DNA recombinase
MPYPAPAQLASLNGACPCWTFSDRPNLSNMNCLDVFGLHAINVQEPNWTEMPLIVGYGRTSSFDQQAGLDAQIRDLEAAGCEKVFSEQISAAGKREQLRLMIEFVREGDVIVVTKPDRLARSTTDLLSIIASLEAKGVGLRVLSMGGTELDTRAPTGRLLLTMLAAIAEFERALMLERQREGIAKAKADGKYRGRAPTARRQVDVVRDLKAEGLRPVDIAARLKISRSSVYAMLDKAKPAS